MVKIKDTEIETIINKTKIAYIKKEHPEHYKVLQLGAYLIKNNINCLEEIETLINIKSKLLVK